MKKLIALLLALAMVLSLAACGGNKAPETTAPAATDAVDATDAVVALSLNNFLFDIFAAIFATVVFPVPDGP